MKRRVGFGKLAGAFCLGTLITANACFVSKAVSDSGMLMIPINISCHGDPKTYPPCWCPKSDPNYDECAETKTALDCFIDKICR